jgi:hypothetical protein
MIDQEFENYRGSVDMMGIWIFRLLGVLLEPLPPALYLLEKRYSSVIVI